MAGTDDGAAVELHPGADLGEGRGVVRRDRAAAVGADVQQHVAAHRDRVDQHLHQQPRGLVVHVVAVIPPGAVHRLARLPGLRRAVDGQGRGGLVLLRGDEVAGDAEAVVDEHARLQLAAEREQARRVPVVGRLPRPAVLGLRVGVVEEEVVDPPVARQQLPDLAVQEGTVAGHVAALVQGVGRLVVAARVHPVDGEVRVMPVDQRVVQPDAQPLGPDGVDELAHQVAPARARRREVRQCGVPEREALVVLRRQDHIAGPGQPGGAGDGSGIEAVGLEVVEVDAVLVVGQPLVGLHPLVTRGAAVEAEVDEQPEAGLGEPAGHVRW